MPSDTLSFDIAVGNHRYTKKWRNRTVTWSAFVEKCSQTHRTPETFKVYLNASKDRQAEIKDVGAFVGGLLAQGKRTNSAVIHRQLVTLDADFARRGLWSSFLLRVDACGLAYSTHKHSPEHPRLRLVLPLDRPVSPDEYEPIARRVADWLDIEQFDPTTFQPARLMYWPSTSSDGEFYFQEHDGPVLIADEVLATYHDWTDVSQWPISDAEKDIVRTGLAKQGNPLEKDGIVGAFCRTYSIQEAIEKFVPEYVPTGKGDGRYSYSAGTSSSGVAIYDDRFSYSHHSSDPAGGRLLNAFDLVRLHKFGEQDERFSHDTHVTKLPSYGAMAQFAGRDPEVRKQLLESRMGEVLKAFGDDYDDFEDGEEPEPVDVEWLKGISVDKNGEIRKTYDNLLYVMHNDPNLKGVFGYNLFSHTIEVIKRPPWARPNESEGWKGLEKEDRQKLYTYLGREPYEFKTAAQIDNCLTAVADQYSFHSVCDYLSKLDWDGKPRLDTLFIDYLGVEDTELHRAITRKTLTAAVARVFKPGCKMDYVLTLISEEGRGKSTLIRALGKTKWYSDSLNFDMIAGKGNGKMGFEQIHNKWIIETAEMTGLGKAEVEAVKGYLTSREDYYRPSHAPDMVSRKRQCIFIGTSNNDEFLVGDRGNRRFWPMPIRGDARGVKAIPDEDDGTDRYAVWQRTEIDQVWAEAVYRYEQGEKLYLPHNLEKQMKEIQAQHTQRDEREELIAQYLEMRIPEGWEELNDVGRKLFIMGYQDIPAEERALLRKRRYISSIEIWKEALGGQGKDFNQAVGKLVRGYMLHGGKKEWKPANYWENGVRKRGYERINLFDLDDEIKGSDGGTAVLNFRDLLL